MKKLDPSTADGPNAPRQAEAVRAKLLQKIEDLEHKSRKNPFFSLTASSEDRRTIESLNRHDREAIGTALDFRNRTLRAGAEAQAALAVEVFETLLAQEISTLRTNLVEYWGREMLRLNGILEEQSEELQARMITLLDRAELQPDLIRKMMIDRAEIILRQWQTTTEQVLTDFAQILQS